MPEPQQNLEDRIAKLEGEVADLKRCRHPDKSFAWHDCKWHCPDCGEAWHQTIVVGQTSGD